MPCIIVWLLKQIVVAIKASVDFNSDILNIWC
jgi:hypothetical protein